MIAFRTACSVPWAILPSSLEQILEITQRDRLHGDDLTAKIEALAAKVGRPLDNTRSVVIREGGVAVIPICGPIVRHADMFTDISGGCTTEALATDLQEALANSRVSSIVLEIDSPGGESAGIGEFASHIFAASMRKPVVAYVSSLGASAAYWLASAASEIVISPSAVLGSIGTVMVHTDTSAIDEKRGIKKHEIVSSQSPNKRPDLNTDDGRSQIQSLVDALTDVFGQDVARYRGVDLSSVWSDFGRGGCLVGLAAVEAGMADRLGTLEGVIAELAESSMRNEPSKLIRREEKPKPTATLPVLSKGPRMNFKDTVKAWFGAGMPDDFDPTKANANVTPVATAPLNPSVVQATDPGVIAAMEALKAQVLALTNANATAATQAVQTQAQIIETEATAFVTSEIRALRLHGTEQTQAKLDYIQAYQDDLSAPLSSGSRVGRLKDRQAVRPPHNLTQSLVSNSDLPPGATTLANTSKADQEKADMPGKVASLLSMTPKGQALLARNGGSVPKNSYSV